MTIILLSEIFDIWDKLPLRNSKKIAFIANAKDTYEKTSRLKKYKDFLRDKGYFLEEIDLREVQGEKLLSKLKQFDIVYLGGGNTFYLLEIIRKSGLDKILPQLLGEGIIFIGQSAGACVFGSSIEPMKYADSPEFSSIKDYSGLKYVDFVLIPHSNNEKYLEAIKRIERDFSSKYDLKKIGDSEGILIEDENIKNI